MAWGFRKGHGGPKKKISTQGYFSRTVIQCFLGLRGTNVSQ